jgi:PKD repeat protein
VTGTHSYADNGGYVVRVRVRDDDGAEGTDALTVAVANVAPTVDAGADRTGDDGSPIAFSATFTDPGTVDSHTATIDWGDGTVEAGAIDATARTVSGTHTYADNGVYTVRVTVTDDDGGVGSDTAVVALANAVPVLTALTAAPRIVEGELLTLTGAFTDPDLGDAHTVVVEWGEGVAETVALAAGARAFTLTHRYLDDDPTGTSSDAYVIRVRIRDDDDAETAGEVTTLVANAAPEAAVVAPSAGVPGVALSFAGAFTDPGTLDTHEIAWDFGDGTTIGFHASTDGGALTPTHAFATTGTYTVTLSVRDDDGGVDTATASVVIDAIALLTDPCDPGALALFVVGTSEADTIWIVPAGLPIPEKSDCHDDHDHKGSYRADTHDDLAPGGTGGDVEIWINGVRRGAFAHTGRIIVYGLEGDDAIEIVESLPNEIEFHGGAGDDQLEAGAGAALLLGEAGDDYLTGSGRGLLIGGAGKDHLVGGPGDDILIPGSTIYDADVQALCALVHAWAHDEDHDARVAALRAGVDGVRLTAETVLDDGVEDHVTGNWGDDWFFATAAGQRRDKLTDRSRGEQLTALTPVAPTPAPEPCRPVIDWDRVDDDRHDARPGYSKGGWVKDFVLELAADPDPNEDIRIELACAR